MARDTLMGTAIRDTDSMKDKIILAWSGGKDCLMTLVKLQQAYRYDVTHLLTTVNAQTGRTISHDVPLDLITAQAEALDIPLQVVEVPEGSSNWDYEDALESALYELRQTDIYNHVAYGDLFLEDVRAYRDAHLHRIGMKGIYPLWGRDTRGLAHEFIDMGFKALTVCVDLTQLNQSFIGRDFDTNFLRDLPPHVDPCGENGEFHTFVYDGPGFRKLIPFEVQDLYQRDNRFVYCGLELTDGS
jgi:uncharacterized protein (TIGR00290 family)